MGEKWRWSKGRGYEVNAGGNGGGESLFRRNRERSARREGGGRYRRRTPICVKESPLLEAPNRKGKDFFRRRFHCFGEGEGENG